MLISKKTKKLANRIIAKVFKYTHNRRIQLFLMNFSSKLFVDRNNHIQLEKSSNLFWLKNDGKYLFAVDEPYFDFSEKKMFKKIQDIFCQYYNPKKGDVIIDIGAGIGTGTNFFVEKIQDEGKLYAIEASPNCFRKVESLIKKNRYKNVYVYNMAISNFNGKTWFQEEERNYVIGKINNRENGTEITAATLDEFIAENQIHKINFLKVNIEGAEYEMVDGMKNVINRIENIAVSCHDFLSGGKSNRIREKVERFLTNNNFEIFHRNTGNEILDSWIYAKKNN